MRPPKAGHIPSPDEVRALRERHGLSQSEMVARLEPAAVTRRSWQNYEQGVRAMPAVTWRYALAQLGELTLPE